MHVGLLGGNEGVSTFGWSLAFNFSAECMHNSLHDGPCSDSHWSEPVVVVVVVWGIAGHNPHNMLADYLHAVLTVAARPSLMLQAVGSNPEVWLQLLEHCAVHLNCHPRIVCDLAQQLAEQRAIVVQQQQALSEQGARIAALEGQLQNALASARQQQQPSDHQQGAAEQVVIEQGTRIAVLEGQVQALLQRFPPL